MTSTAETPTTSATGRPEQVRRLVTEVPGPRSRELMARREAAVASPANNLLPVFAERAGGGVLVDVDGNHFVDLGSGIAVTGVGNADPEVAAAVAEQAHRFTHTSFSVVPYEGYVAVAERLNALVPISGPVRTALFNSGAEAVENAVKVARRATGRQAVVAFDHGYHGRTYLAMALTAKTTPFKEGFGPFAPEVYRVPGSYPFRDGLTGEQAAARAIELVESQIGASSVAAVIIEPVAGEGGFIVPADGFFPALRRWATANGVVLIADEIQSGFGRTGRWFAIEHEGVEPDLVTTAKGLAGGMPLSAVTGRAALMDAAQPGALGGTYSGNPVACAGAVATIDAYRERGLLERSTAIGQALVSRLEEAATGDPRIGEVRGRGSMVAVELVDPATGAPDKALTGAVARYAHQRGVILLTCGTHGNVVRFLPPFVIDDALLHDALDVVLEGLAAS